VDEGPYSNLTLDKGKGAFQVARMLPPSRVDYFYSSRVSDGDQKYPPLYMLMVLRERIDHTLYTILTMPYTLSTGAAGQAEGA
jgi:hypothetical protein